MKKNMLVIFAAVIALIGCNDKGVSSANISTTIDFMAGDVHSFINADVSELADRYVVLSLEFMPEEGKFERSVTILPKGISFVTDKYTNAYSGVSADERTEAAQAVFDSFSKKHGEVADKTTHELPSEVSYGSKIKRTIYKFEKEGDKLPLLQFDWSHYTLQNKTYYELKVVEMHML